MRLSKRFVKWETAKREKLGVEKFLSKYIKDYKLSDKINKVIWIGISCVIFFILVRQCAFCFTNFSFDTLLPVVYIFCWFVTTCVLCIFIYKYSSYAMYWQHIERWEKELAELHTEEQ